VAAASPHTVAVPIESFLGRLAEGSPTPGGGAAVALVTATAAALVAMVARVALARADDAELREIADAADRARRQALALVSEDADAYAAVVAARRGGDPSSAAALTRATEAPLAVARTSGTVLDLAATLAPRARPATRSDLRVAVGLAHATLHGAADTARANLHDVDDRAFVERVESELTRIVERGDAARLRSHTTVGGGS
jgi:formiminotetrahydrofolate cyclodeaminase